MKFFWKIYFSFMILLLLAFGAFGTWMIHLVFEKSYQRVLGETERENQMFQLSFEMNLNALDEVYRNDGIIPVTAASIIQNFSDTGSTFRIYNKEQELLYENKPEIPFHDLLLRLSGFRDALRISTAEKRREDIFTLCLSFCYRKQHLLSGKYPEHLRNLSGTRTLL